MQKRGQVTIFIIVGIVILVVFGMLFFFRGELLKSDFQSELAKLKIPDQLKPAKSYIDDCIEDSVLVAARNLGSKGGYSNVPKDNIPRSVVNPFSNSLEIGNSDVAFWYYKSTNNIDKEQIPFIEDMEEDISKHLNENFLYCLKGLDFYVEELFEISQANYVDSEINIEDTHIEVIVNSPTDLRIGEVGMYFEKHLVDVEVNLGKLYKLALEIYEKEKEKKFLEEYTIDMMVVYDEIPYSNTDFECNRKVWQKSEVEKDFKNIVQNNMYGIRLKNSEYYSTRNDNDYFEVDVSGNGVTSNFEYMSSWPFFMEVNPSKGNLMTGDPITQENSDISKYLNMFFCMNNYHFVYDVKYPVLIGLSDDKGFSFQFANMVVIDKNTPRKYEGEIISYDDAGILGEEFCENKINTIDVEVVDASNYNNLNNVDISYSCMGSSCYIGRTSPSGLVNKFPICINGEIHADKQGYFSVSELLSSDVDSKTSLLLEPYYELNVDFRVVDLRNGEIRNLENGEDAIFQFENMDNGYVTSVVSGVDEIMLVAGDYFVTSYLMKELDDPIEIKGQTYTECVDAPRASLLGILGFKKEECFETKTEDSELENYLAGGSAFEFRLDHTGLKSSDELVLYVVEDDEPSNYNEMFDIFNNIEKNALNQNFRYPELR